MRKLSIFQLVTTTCTGFIPLLLWIYPRYAVTMAGIDGQWAVIGVCIIGLGVAVIHGLLNLRFPKSAGYDMLVQAYGKWLGTIGAVSFVPGYLLFIATSLFSFSITLKALLPNTPRLATAAALLVVAVMGAIYGLEAIARVAAFVFPITLFVLYFSCGFVSFEGQWTGVFFRPANVGQSVWGAVQLLPLFFGFNVFLMFSPYYDHRKRNSLWIALTSASISSVTLIAVYIITVVMVGFAGIKLLAHPIDFIMQLAQVHGLLIQRLGILLVFLVTMFEGVFCSIHLWALSLLCLRTFHLKQERRKWVAMLCALAVLVVFYMIPNQTTGDEVVHRILMPLSWFYLVFEPLLKLVVSLIRGVPKEQSTRRKKGSMA